MGNLSALGNTVVQTTPVGVIEAFAGANAPAGWLFCDGSAVSRIQYPELFSALGTTYGSGDGSTTFNLPDLRGRVPAGKDNMGGVAANRLTSANSGITATSLGANGGDERLHQHTHTQNAHSHQVRVNSFAGDRQIACGPLGADGDKYSFTDSGNDASTNTALLYAANTTATNQNTGSGNSQNVQPTLIVNYIIKAVADLPRGGWFYQNQPPVVTQLPSNPQIGEEVYHYISNTGRYLLRRWNGSSWSYVGNNILQILMTTDTGAGSHNLTSYGIVGDLTTTITTNGDSRIMVDGNLGSMQPGTGNAMAVVKCDYNNTSTSSSDFTNLVAGTSAEWSHNGYDLKNLPFSGMTGTLAAGTYTFRVKIKSIQGYVLQWNWHSMQDQISWLKLTEIGVV